MPGLIHGLDPARIAANLEQVREVVGEGVEILAATKYVPPEEMGALSKAGVTLVGENRQQELSAKNERWGDTFEWDFIGNLQSRKVRQLLPICRLIHSVASDSALAQLGRHGEPRNRGPGRGKRRRRGRQERRRASRSRRLHRALPGAGGRPDDDAAVQPGSRGLPPPFRPPRRAGRRRTASTGSRWAPPRTGVSRSRRGRRSSGWGRRCTCERRYPGIIPKGVGLRRPKHGGEYGLTRHMAQSARLLRPRRGP